MSGERFDRHTVVSRVLEGKAGYTELWRTETGGQEICVFVTDPELQKCLLMQMDGDLPLRLEAGRLSVLLPWQPGRNLREWLYEEQPDLDRRRQACASLLEQMLTQPIPAELLALSARPENLRFGPKELRLQLFPDLSDWKEPLGTAQAVDRVAALMAQILTDDLRGRIDQKVPEELELLVARSGCHGYESWEELHRDLCRIPRELSSVTRRLSVFRTRLQKKLRRWMPAAVRIAVAGLVLAAAVSAAAELRDRMTDAEQPPGVTQISREETQGEEDGP